MFISAKMILRCLALPANRCGVCTSEKTRLLCGFRLHLAGDLFFHSFTWLQRGAVELRELR